MSIVSHLHQLFNAETCHSYIHALRWKERPLQCPRCQSHNVGPWVGCPNRRLSVDRILDSGCQSRLSSAWGRSIFKESVSSRVPQLRPMEFFITR
jgi:hypothetical protein